MPICPYQLRLELGGGAIAEAHMRALFVVVSPPLLNAGLEPMTVPLDREALVPELAIERFVCAGLPRFTRVNECGLDLRPLQPSQDGGCHELRSVVGAQVPRRPVQAHQ